MQKVEEELVALLASGLISCAGLNGGLFRQRNLAMSHKMAFGCILFCCEHSTLQLGSAMSEARPECFLFSFTVTIVVTIIVVVVVVVCRLFMNCHLLSSG